jgi:hypothetical protein
VRQRSLLLLIVILLVTSCQKIDEGDIANMTTPKVQKEKSDGVGSQPYVIEGSYINYYPKNAHMPALSEDLGNGSVRYMLISLTEWSDIVLSATSGSSLVETVDSYREGSMTGWHLPSKDEAQIIRSSVLPRLDTFNSDISSLGGTPLSGTVRYLCASFEFTYAFKEKTTVSKAGQKTKYSIRLVKDTVISHNISVNF